MRLAVACGDGSPGPGAAQAAVGIVAASSGDSQPDDGQWLMAAKDYANHRYSGLEEINYANVGSLRLAWTFSTGVLRGHEAAPLVVGDTMYYVTPFPNILYALDLKNSGAKKWEYKPKPSTAAQGVACCDVVNRGAAYADGKVVYNTLDGYTVAVNATDGNEAWKTKLGDINLGETITMAPVIVKGKVLVGNSGGEFGVRGWITALNIADGSIAWRAFSTGLDADVLIGDRFHPFCLDTDTAPPAQAARDACVFSATHRAARRARRKRKRIAVLEVPSCRAISSAVRPAVVDAAVRDRSDGNSPGSVTGQSPPS